LLELIEVTSYGAYKVKNASIAREKNHFIHEYILERREEVLTYTKKPERKKEEEEKDQPLNEMQK
jgi:hypothetical protein